MNSEVSTESQGIVAQIREANTYLVESQSKANFHEASLNSARRDVQATERRLVTLQEQLMKSILKSPGATPVPGPRNTNKITNQKAGV